MKNERTPRTLADSVYRTSYPFSVPTRRARLIEKVAGSVVILSLVLFSAWAITGA